MAKQMNRDVEGHARGHRPWRCWRCGRRMGMRSRRGCGTRGSRTSSSAPCTALLVRIEQRSLVDVEKVASEKGPPRKVYSLNPAAGVPREFWTWSFLAERIEQLRRSIEQNQDREK